MVFDNLENLNETSKTTINLRGASVPRFKQIYSKLSSYFKHYLYFIPKKVLFNN